MADDLYRLFRYDRKSAANAIRATFVGWRDRLSAAVVLLFALAILRSWFADRSWATAVWSAAGGSFLLGLMAGRTIATRLAFHAFDGVLAPDALRAPTRWRYAVGWQVICLAALTGLALVVQATLLPACVPMYIAGTIVGQASAALTRRGPQMPRFARAARRGLQRPFSGVVAALLLLVSLAFVERGAHHQVVVVAAGLGTAGAVLALTILDATAVRFMALAGHKPGSIIFRHARGTLLFLGSATPVCLLWTGSLVTLVIGSISLIALALLAVRVFAYCLYDKPIADLLVSLLAALLIATAFYAAVVLPLVMIVSLTWLGRRAVHRTWLLA